MCALPGRRRVGPERLTSGLRSLGGVCCAIGTAALLGVDREPELAAWSSSSGLLPVELFARPRNELIEPRMDLRTPSSAMLCLCAGGCAGPGGRAEVVWPGGCSCQGVETSGLRSVSAVALESVRAWVGMPPAERAVGLLRPGAVAGLVEGWSSAVLERSFSKDGAGWETAGTHNGGLAWCRAAKRPRTKQEGSRALRTRRGSK